MANKPFEYTIINPLERPTSTDINQLQAQAHYDVRLLAEQLFAGAEGFVGDSAKAVPLPVPSLGFSWTPGIMFTVGTAENNIGAISGLSDSYLYKATNIAYRPFNVTTAPATSGYVRYDLLEVRALTGSERLTDSTSVGIFNPLLGSFNVATSKYKTLTSSLDPLTTVEEIAYNVTGTAPLVYKSGQEIAYPGSWSLVPKPAVDAGYLAVAYIRRFEGQTEITSGAIEDARTLLTVPSSTIATVPVIKGGTGQDTLPLGEILLGNGTSSITSTAILPVSKGGTGNSSTSAFTGSVAWFDSATDQIKYTQAQLGAPSFLPISGYLLSSNTSGAPTWIAPGAAGQVLVSTGTAWQSGVAASLQTHDFNTTKFTTTAYQEVATFTATAIPGVARIGMQPQKDNDVSDFWAWNQDIGNDGYVWLKFEVQKTGGTTEYYLVKYTVHGPASGVGYIQSLAYPSISVPVESGDYDIRLYVKCPPTSAVNIQVAFLDCALFFAQG